MELEIKVMWCKGLTTFNFFQKLTVYTSLSITSSNQKIQLTQDQKQEQKTPIDENGEGDPEWNYTMKFDLQPLRIINPNLNDFSLLFEFRCPGQLFGDKTIGEVRVPLMELIQSVSSDIFRFVKYEVRNSEGKHNGVLDFCYKLIGNVVDSNHDVQITGYNHHHHHHHHHYHHDRYDDHQIQEQHYTNSDSEIHNHMIEHNQTHFNESISISNSDVIQYPKIDFDEHLDPPLVYPPSSSSSSSSSSSLSYHTSSSSFTSSNDIHYSTSDPLVYPPLSSSSSSSSSYYHTSLSSSFTSSTDTHYNPSAPPLVYPPPSSQTWNPATLPPPSHYPPPPLQQPHVYPPPPFQQQPQPYGDPHWGYHRAHSYH